MLDLRLPAALEVGFVAILAQAQRVPEADRWLHTQLALEGTERRVCVQCPVSPCAASQSILEQHAHDSSHGKTAICELGI